MPAPRLAPGAFDVQGLRQLPRPVFLRRLGDLNPAQMQQIAQTIKLWLGLV